MKPKEIKSLSHILKAISDPTRRAIFDLLLSSEKKESISTVAAKFKITRQGITKHLKMMEVAKLVKLKRIGRVTYCTATAEPLNKAKTWIDSYLISTEPPLENATELTEALELIEDLSPEELEAQEELKGQLLQLSIDPEDPGQPVVAEPVTPEPVVKEVKEKPIEVTDNQLDIYGIRKEPKVNEKNQLEMF